MLLAVDIVCQEVSADSGEPVFVDYVCEEIDADAMPWAVWIRLSDPEDGERTCRYCNQPILRAAGSAYIRDEAGEMRAAHSVCAPL